MMDHVEVSLESQPLHTYSNNKPSFYGRKDHSMGQDRNSQSIYHRIEQCCCAHCFPYWCNVDASLFNYTVKHLSCATAFFSQEKSLSLKIFYGYNLPLCPAFIRTAYNTQMIFHVGFRNDIWIMCNTFDQRTIQFICQNFLVDCKMKLDT